MINTKKNILSFYSASILLTINLTVSADWTDKIPTDLGKQLGPLIQSKEVQSQLTDSEMIKGLKAALAQGAESAINSLGSENGYFNNELVKILLPKEINKVSKLARQFGAGSYVDTLEKKMNQAAETAVPQTASIIADTINNLSIEDAQKLLAGKENSATEFFREKTSTQLAEKIKPIVSSSMSQVGVYQAYQNLIKKAGPMVSMLGNNSLDMDNYITDKSVDGVFTMIAEEEKKIRSNPLQQGSDIIKKVFSSFKK